MKVFWFFFAKKNKRFFLNPSRAQKEAKTSASSGSAKNG
jgi:hypothetical protein